MRSNIDRVAFLEALLADWSAMARATGTRSDPHSKRLRARAVSLDILLADLRERLAALASTAAEIEGLICEEGAEDAVEETAAAREAAAA